MTEEFEVKMSPLCQKFERDGKTVEIEIYENGEGGWILETVDEFNNSTLWDDPFSSDQAALEEVLSAIEKEGIECLIGPVSG
ncbi:MAG: hypothetical protein V7731_02235 [Amphritea sp.]